MPDRVSGFSIIDVLMAKKILLIDSDKETLSCITVVLVSEGYEVMGHTSAKDIGANILAFKPDLILLNFAFPKPEGMNMYKAIKVDYSKRSVPVLMISTKNNVREIEKHSNDEIILKPFDLNDLLEKVRETMHPKIVRFTAS